MIKWGLQRISRHSQGAILLPLYHFTLAVLMAIPFHPIIDYMINATSPITNINIAFIFTGKNCLVAICHSSTDIIINVVPFNAEV